MTAAAANGWKVTYATNSRWILRIQRPGSTVLVEFDVLGGVSYASTNDSVMTGSGKAVRIIKYLEA